MKKILFFLFLTTITFTRGNAQNALKKVYDESINPIIQIDEALSKAKAENKFVVCQVGGNWCPWCLRFADFVEKDTAVHQIVSDNFIYAHINYNPRQIAGSPNAENTKTMMKRLGNV